MTQLKADREILLSKLNKAVKFIPKNAVMPIYNDFVFAVDKDSGIAMVTAANGSAQITIECVVNASDSFAFCVPAKLFVNTLQLMHYNDVTINIKNSKMEIKCGKSKYKIALQNDPEIFSMMGIKTISNEMAVNQGALKTAFSISEKFTSNSAISENMSGINIKCIDNRIVTSAVDSFIMSRCSIPPLSISTWGSFTIDTDNSSLICGLLNDKGEIGVLSDGERMEFFTTSQDEDKYSVIVCLMNTKFPDTEKIFANRPKDFVTINTAEFRDAIKRLSIYSAKGVVPLIKTKTDKEVLHLTLYNELEDRGGEEEMTISNLSGKDFAKNFNFKQLISILSSFDNTEFNMYFDHTSSKIPMFIEPVVMEGQEKNFDFAISTLA